MSRRAVALIVLGLAVVLHGCAARTPYDPFKVPREQFQDRLKVVALGPLGVPRDMENPDPVRAKFDGLIEAHLRQGGYTVVGSIEAKAIWDSLTTQANGFFDPVTGDRDEAKVKEARLQMYRELKAKFNIDGMLFSHIGVVPAKLDNDRAKWDGASEGAARKKFWKALLGVSHSGTIPALSLHVVLSDTEDRALYDNRGGIQVLAKAGVGGLQDVPRQELFLDEERNDKAVHLALDPLLGRPVKK